MFVYLEEKIVVAITCLPGSLEKPTEKNPCPENYFYQVRYFFLSALFTCSSPGATKSINTTLQRNIRPVSADLKEQIYHSIEYDDVTW